MGEDRTEGAQLDKEYVTVGEAAKLLGVHRNTIHHRIKKGRIRAHKVVEADREVYRVERDSLDVGRTSADVCTLDAQRTTTSEELSRMIATRLDEIVRDYTNELGDLREELGTERARREMAEATLQEGMAEERQRREDAERERDELRRELKIREMHARGREQGAHKAAGERPSRGMPWFDTGGTQEGAVRRLWRKWRSGSGE